MAPPDRQYVIVGRDAPAREPSIAFGPFPTVEEANQERDFLAARTTATYYVLTLWPLTTPSN